MKSRTFNIRRQHFRNFEELEYAKLSLKYQSEDRKEQRKKESIREQRSIIVILSVVFMFFAFTTIALIMEKDDMVTEILKVFAYICGAGLTGYGIGVHKKTSRESGDLTN